jgi:hypothetical protein
MASLRLLFACVAVVLCCSSLAMVSAQLVVPRPRGGETQFRQNQNPKDDFCGNDPKIELAVVSHERSSALRRQPRALFRWCAC